jgi:hypothetical protein
LEAEVQSFKTAPSERKYWGELWVRLKSQVHDSLFDYEQFWRLPPPFIWECLSTLIEQQKDRANEASISTALLIDTVARLLATDYQGSAVNYLPHPPKAEKPAAEDGVVLTPKIETLRVLFAEIKKRSLPVVFLAQIAHLLPDWKKRIE